MVVAEVGLEIIMRATRAVLVNTGSVQRCLRAVTSSKAQVSSPQAFLVNSIATNGLKPTQNRRGGELRSLSLSVCVCLSFSLPGHRVNKATIYVQTSNQTCRHPDLRNPAPRTLRNTSPLFVCLFVLTLPHPSLPSRSSESTR